MGKIKTIPKTRACTKATVMVEPLGGKRNKTLGVKTKNKIAEYNAT